MISNSFLLRKIGRTMISLSKERALSLAVICSTLCTMTADAGLKIYYIRHAEAGHNVREDWEARDISEDEWPSYVGDHDQYTPKGLEQVARVSAMLQSFEGSFDLIASSPMWRSRNVILPYMKDVGATGVIWPELSELHTSTDLILAAGLPTIDPSEVLGQGNEIELPVEEIPYYSLIPTNKHKFDISDSYSDEEDAAANRVVYQAVIDRILDSYDGTDAKVLLAGHGASGKALIRMLTNRIGDVKEGDLVDYDSIINAGVWMVEQQSDGTFDVKMYNSEPLTSTVRFDKVEADLGDAEINGEDDGDSNVSISNARDGNDLVYSFLLENQNFDNVGGYNDSLSWDIRVKAYEGGTVIMDLHDSTVILGENVKARDLRSGFCSHSNGDVREDETIQFSVENIELTAEASTTVVFNGFDGLYGSKDSYVFGVGNGGLESLVTDDGDDFTIYPTQILTVSNPGPSDFRISELTGLFSINSAPSDLGVTYHAADFDDESHSTDNSIVRDMVSKIGFIKNATWVSYSDFNFSDGASSIDVSTSSRRNGGTIEVRLGSPTGTMISSIPVTGTGSWNTYESFSGDISTPVSGMHDLYFVFTGGSGFLFNIETFEAN